MSLLSVLFLSFVALSFQSEDASELLKLNKQKFVDFIVKYNKTYATATEHNSRFEIFQQNLLVAEKHQKNSKHARFGVTKFMDWTVEEFKQKRLGPKMPAQGLATSCLVNGVTAPQYSKADLQALPDNWDWSQKGIPISMCNLVFIQQNQGDCGSCWTFSVTGSVEGQWAMKGNKLTSFSEQQIVDCSHACCNVPGYGNVCNQGCEGGWQWNAFYDVVSWGGLEKESDYPYQGVTGSCAMNKAKVMAPIKNYTCLSGGSTPADEEQMRAYIYKNGPISIALDAGLLQTYYGGIVDPFFPSLECDPNQLDHALLIVGWGQERNWIFEMTPYWYVKNSWGADWGDAGYFLIARNYNMCGIANAVSAAVM